MINIRIPSPLRKLTDGKEMIACEGKTIREVFFSMSKEYPAIKNRIFSDDGELKKFVNIYLNNEDIRFLNNLDTEVHEGDTITIIPAIAGGR